MKQDIGYYQEFGDSMMKQKIQFVAGIILALTGAFLMGNGSILGENITGIAIIIGIVGIGLIAISKFRLLK